MLYPFQQCIICKTNHIGQGDDSISRVFIAIAEECAMATVCSILTKQALCNGSEITAMLFLGFVSLQ